MNCSRPLDQAWTICPYCEADVPGIASPRQRRRRAVAVDSERSDGAEADAERPIVIESGEPEDAEAAPAVASEAAARRPSGAPPAPGAPRARPRAPAGARARPPEEASQHLARPRP